MISYAISRICHGHAPHGRDVAPEAARAYIALRHRLSAVILRRYVRSVIMCPTNASLTPLPAAFSEIIALTDATQRQLRNEYKTKSIIFIVSGRKHYAERRDWNYHIYLKTHIN